MHIIHCLCLPLKPKPYNLAKTTQVGGRGCVLPTQCQRNGHFLKAPRILQARMLPSWPSAGALGCRCSLSPHNWSIQPACHTSNDNAATAHGRAHTHTHTHSLSSSRWPDVADAARRAYGLRYQLLSYLMGSLYLVSARGGTLARPLLFTDPADTGAR